ncbi:putative disease resistance RPP8-like protein 4 [Cinnamomum micranthum f. kanehirae]|uniref:Putative disease resistance RPP8-like protein 4 n=1 Tax=Cinnamomum micranthum f. kanehirae TaxID=337451 RepID=A0A3S3NUV9_9MAGN|nr:putative disease resistance RPP8-like protein 4 [Cinnamomum micranthum f. kanehirae]
MADTVVSLFVKTLGGLLTQELKLLSGVHDDLAWIKAEHESMEACLINADRRRRRDKDVEAWVGQVRHLVFAAEDAIDSFMIEREMQRHLRDESVMHCVAFHICFIKRLMVRRQFRAQIQRIRSDVKEVYERRGRYNLQDVKEPTSSSTPDGGHGDPGVAAPFIEEEDIVGTENIVKELLSVVEENKEYRFVISIVGMGGLGKTTLAKKLYKNIINEKFKEDTKCHAWISVSESFQTKDLLKEMLKEFRGSREAGEMNESNLRENIFNHLQALQQKTPLVTPFGDKKSMLTRNAHKGDKKFFCLSRKGSNQGAK